MGHPKRLGFPALLWAWWHDLLRSDAFMPWRPLCKLFGMQLPRASLWHSSFMASSVGEKAVVMPDCIKSLYQFDIWSDTELTWLRVCLAACIIWFLWKSFEQGNKGDSSMQRWSRRIDVEQSAESKIESPDIVSAFTSHDLDWKGTVHGFLGPCFGKMHIPKQLSGWDQKWRFTTSWRSDTICDLDLCLANFTITNMSSCRSTWILTWILRKATKIYGTSSFVASCSPCLCLFWGHLASYHGCQNDATRKTWWNASAQTVSYQFHKMGLGFYEAWIALFWRGSQVLKAHGRTQQGYCTLNHIYTYIILYRDYLKTKLCWFPIAKLWKSWCLVMSCY